MLASHDPDPQSAHRLPLTGAPTRPIEYEGIFLGTVVGHELGVRFIAGHARVTDMNQSIWPTSEHAEQSARQLFRATRARV